MNRILSVVRSMTNKIIELSRAVVTARPMGKVTVGWSRAGQRIDGHGGHVRWRGDTTRFRRAFRSSPGAGVGQLTRGAGRAGVGTPLPWGTTSSMRRRAVPAARHGGPGAGTCLTASCCGARRRIRRSAAYPHCRHTVMSIPVRRSIIACGVSGSRGSGAGCASRVRHRARLRARANFPWPVAD